MVLTEPHHGTMQILFLSMEDLSYIYSNLTHVLQALIPPESLHPAISNAAEQHLPL